MGSNEGLKRGCTLASDRSVILRVSGLKTSIMRNKRTWFFDGKIWGNNLINEPKKENSIVPIRPLKLPQDFDLVERMVIDSFHYPENPDWNIQDDQLQNIQESLATYKKLWPLMNFFGLFSYQIRNSLGGYLWEEDDKPAGVVMNNGLNKEDWEVGTLGVLPEFRRQGIARKLLEHSIAEFKTRNAKRVFLSVIAGNVPAQTLYLNHGFIDFTGRHEIEHSGGEVPEPILPEGFIESEMDRFDWRPKFELADKITPDEVRKFAPIKETDFKNSSLLKLIVPIFDKLQGTRQLCLLYRTADTNEIAGRIVITLRTREGGVVDAFVRLAPGQEALGDYLCQKILHLAYTHSPGRRITMELPTWQEDAWGSAQKAGFTSRVELREMALNLSV
jgi:ribosomal protein S18 acetylase RimI-like enzyme